MIGNDKQKELQALRAAAEWLNSAGWPEQFAALPAGQRAANLRRQHGVSRRKLDLAINAVKDGFAHPSQVFPDSREMAARLMGRELTLSELRGIVQGIQKIMEMDNETDKPKLLAANVGRREDARANSCEQLFSSDVSDGQR